MTDNYDIIKDFLVPTDIVVEELGTNRSKITLEPFEQVAVLLPGLILEEIL